VLPRTGSLPPVQGRTLFDEIAASTDEMLTLFDLARTPEASMGVKTEQS
jgi:hypothetical protein